MTGISDIARSVRYSVRRSILTLPMVVKACAWFGIHLPSEDVLGSMPLPKYGFFKEKSIIYQESSVLLPKNSDPPVDENPFTSFPPSLLHADVSTNKKWGLLLPICCRDTNGGAACFRRLDELVLSLDETVAMDARSSICILVAIDEHDIVFDCDDARSRVTDLFGVKQFHDVRIIKLRSHYRGKLCRIWDLLAQEAASVDCSFFLLIGDDVRFTTPDWKPEIEKRFDNISRSRMLPYGVGCVSFRDLSFDVFPTFPVMHVVHLKIFGSLFPTGFINQHGDPYLFEIYRRFGASEFADATLRNTIGGNDAARYAKHNFVWQTDILSRSVSKVVDYLEDQKLSLVPERFRCINVVVPSFRCDKEFLSRITSLQVSGKTSVHFLVVVDNPHASTSSLTTLHDWTPNHLVRVYHNASNVGASESRNVGIAQSFGDWVVLLDDDVIPDSDILDVYLGATVRFPNGKIFVGLTTLPDPSTLMQKALHASQMTYFYDISRRVKNPPWGVTANQCIKTSLFTVDEIRFSNSYPKTGGGEDVDFCLKVKDITPQSSRLECIVSVPEARVQHPFWADITKQVVGWAWGDVKCLSAFPDRTFYAPPNWIEFILLLLLVNMAVGAIWSLLTVAQLSSFVIAIEIALTAITSFPNVDSTELSFFKRTLIAVLASHPVMMQDVTRLRSKLFNMNITHFCLQFDWLDGTKDHVQATRLAQFIKTCFFLTATAFFPITETASGCCGACVLLLVALFAWGRSQNFTRNDEVKMFLNELEPLPFEFPLEGPKPFVILASQRTGSNYLCGRLHNHFQVVMHNEVFNEAKIWTYQNEDVLADPTWTWDVFSREANPLAFLEDLYSRKPIKKKLYRAIGFKLFPDHWRKTNEDALRRLLADSRIKKVVLRRDDYLAVYSSKLRADKTGKYVKKSLDNIPLHIDPSSFQHFADYYDSCYDYYDSFLQEGSGQSVFRLSYESLTGKDGDVVFNSLLKFLEVDSSIVPPVLSLTTKQTTKPLNRKGESGGVVNFDEVERSFKFVRRMRCSFANGSAEE